MALFQTPGRSSEVRLGAGDPLPRRGDAESTPGRCANLDYCSIGMQRVLVHVPLGDPFVCPECGGVLRAPLRQFRPWRPGVLPMVRISILLGGMIIALLVGYNVGRLQPVVTRAVGTASRTELNTARTLLGLQPLATAAVPARPGAAFPAPPATARPPPVLVSERPYPARMAPVDVTAPPAHLQHEARFGQVTIDCALGSLDTVPVCRLADIRGASTLAGSALAWLKGVSIQYAPVSRGGEPALLDHRWRVIIEDYSGTAAARAP